jgi:hypothetical protein
MSWYNNTYGCHSILFCDYHQKRSKRSLPSKEDMALMKRVIPVLLDSRHRGNDEKCFYPSFQSKYSMINISAFCVPSVIRGFVPGYHCILVSLIMRARNIKKKEKTGMAGDHTSPGIGTVCSRKGTKWYQQEAVRGFLLSGAQEKIA